MRHRYVLWLQIDEGRCRQCLLWQHRLLWPGLYHHVLVLKKVLPVWSDIRSRCLIQTLRVISFQLLSAGEVVVVVVYKLSFKLSFLALNSSELCVSKVIDYCSDVWSCVSPGHGRVLVQPVPQRRGRLSDPTRCLSRSSRQQVGWVLLLLMVQRRSRNLSWWWRKFNKSVLLLSVCSFQ